METIVNKLTSALGTVCLSYLVAVMAVKFLISHESGAPMIMEGLSIFVTRYPHYFLLASLPVAVLNHFISPITTIVCSFAFAFATPRTFLEAIIKIMTFLENMK